MANTAGGFYSWVGRNIKGQVYGDNPVNGLPPNETLAGLQQTLTSSDTVSRAIAADEIAEYREYYDKTWVITVYDAYWRPLGELGDDLMEMVGSDPRNNVPTCTLKIKGGSLFVQNFMACQQTMVGITVETGGMRLAYYVDTFDWEYNSNEWVGTAHCLGIWDVLNYLQIWPNWLLPIQCVAGDTIVQGPDGDHRIDKLAEHGHPFTVWSVTPEGKRVAATATHAFKKGRAELFEYVLDDGSAIKATHGHRFLTDHGFVHGSDVEIGTMIATVGVGEESELCNCPHHGAAGLVRLCPVHDLKSALRRTSDEDYLAVPSGDGVVYRPIVSIQSMGVDDFYDMHVPGWENYLANGFWSHNTQLPGRAIFIWALRTVIAQMIGEAALRIQGGMWELVNNALSLNLDFRAWFGTALVNAGGSWFDRLKHPIYVSPVNPLLDTSPLVARTVRMESCGSVIQDITRAYGVSVTVDLWLPGDEQPDAYAKTFPALTLTQPTYVVRIVDRSQIVGPTGFVLDSVIRTVVDLIGSFFGEIGDVVRTNPGMSGVFNSPLLGVNYVAPWAVVVAPDPGEKGSVASCKLSFHTPKGWQMIIGGRSPGWLNHLFNFIFGWIIDAISILLGFIGIPSSLLDGFLNNAIFAFQLIELYGRRVQVGPYHPCIEVMHPTSSAPYNIETVFAFLNAFWDSRGYVSGQFVFRDGEVYKLGVDIFRGGLVSLVYDGRTKLFTDYVENIMFRYTPDARDVMVQVGDGKAEEAPLAKHQRFISSVIEAVNTITMAPQS